MAVLNIVSEFLSLLRMAKGNRRILVTPPPDQPVSAIRTEKLDEGKYGLIRLVETLRLALTPEDVGLPIFFAEGSDPFPKADDLATLPEAVGAVPKLSRRTSSAVMDLQVDADARFRRFNDSAEEILAKLARNEHYIFGFQG